jgi:large subunit ribosomal protein L3
LACEPGAGDGAEELNQACRDVRPLQHEDGREPPIVATKAIVGEKVGMTQVWDENNRAIPVTVLKIAPLRVVQVKTPEREGYSALQVTWGVQRANSLNKPEQGHFTSAGVEAGRHLVELRLDDASGYEVGQQLTADVMSAGERVDAIAVSKGKGFTGAMKRHNFKGQGASHGNHKKHRSPGSIGACATPARVFKGTRMAGRMGGHQVTTLNLEVVQADAERELILVRGAVPGPRGGMVVLRNTVKGPNASAS